VRLELAIANDSNVLKTKCLFCKYYPKDTEFGFSAHFKYSRGVLHRRCVLRIFPACFAISTGVFRASGGREPRLVLGCYQSTGSVQNRGVQTPGPDAFHSCCRVQRSSIPVCSMVLTGVDYNRLQGAINVLFRLKTHLDPVLITRGAMRMDQATYTPGRDAVSRGFF
jgi:hypothetical protein